jgi:hypothetical protein
VLHDGLQLLYNLHLLLLHNAYRCHSQIDFLLNLLQIRCCSINLVLDRLQLSGQLGEPLLNVLLQLVHLVDVETC